MDGLASGATAMDASDCITVVITDGCGIYWPVLAKMDALTGHITIRLVAYNDAERKPHLAKMDASEGVYTAITAISIKEWGQALGNSTITSDIVDRLFEGAGIINITKGISSRTHGPHAAQQPAAPKTLTQP